MTSIKPEDVEWLAHARATHAQWLADGKPYSNLWIDSADAAFKHIDAQAARIAELEGAARKFTRFVRYILTAYHKILSTQEPAEELVERVGAAIDLAFMEKDEFGKGDLWKSEARAAIKEVWRV